MILLFDVAPEVIGSGGGIVAGAVFLLVFMAAAFIAFKLLKQSVKMAFRMAIVAVILVIAVAGSVALWAIESKPSGRPVPRNQR
jgi:membrane protein implicated in regulation of membrane protease activity